MLDKSDKILLSMLKIMVKIGMLWVLVVVKMCGMVFLLFSDYSICVEVYRLELVVEMIVVKMMKFMMLVV